MPGLSVCSYTVNVVSVNFISALLYDSRVFLSCVLSGIHKLHGEMFVQFHMFKTQSEKFARATSLKLPCLIAYANILLRCLYLVQAGVSISTPKGMDSYGFVDKSDGKTCLKFFPFSEKALAAITFLNAVKASHQLHKKKFKGRANTSVTINFMVESQAFKVAIK